VRSSKISEGKVSSLGEAELTTTRSQQYKEVPFFASSIGLTALLLVVIIVSLTLGRYPLSVTEALGILFSPAPPLDVESNAGTAWTIVHSVRLPRVLLATICGMGLATSGAALQGALRNPLVGPEIVGVSTGAALGGVIAITLSLSSVSVVAFAFCMGLVALVVALGISRSAGPASVLALVLAGVIVNSLCSAITGLLQLTTDSQDKLPSIIFWLLGSFAGANFGKVELISIVTLAAGIPLLAMRWRINVLSLSDIDAAALGVNVAWSRWLIMLLVALIVAAQVAVSGAIGWIGLIIPHWARFLVGPDHTRLLPTAAVLGAIYLLLMDDLARSVSQAEIPIGFLTSIIGAPIFAILFWRTRRRGWAGV
jgi:iron complex transport system permease protein